MVDRCRSLTVNPVRNGESIRRETAVSTYRFLTTYRLRIGYTDSAGSIQFQDY